MINTGGLIESASLETQQNNTCNGGGHKWPKTFWVVYFASWMLGMVGVIEGIRQYDSSDTGHSDNVNMAAEHQEPAEVLSQLDNTSNSPVYGEYKCC